MMPADPETPKFENVLNLSAQEREAFAIGLAKENNLEGIRKRISNTYKALSQLPLANGILNDNILKHEVSNLSALRQIELRAFRIIREMND